MKRALGPVVVTLFYLALAPALARWFPSVNGDEIGNAVHGANLFDGLGQRYSLYDNVFDQSIYPLRDAAPEISKVFYNVYTGFWIELLGKTYWKARFSSAFAGVLVLLLLYGIGKKMVDPAFGLLCAALCLIQPIFLVSTALLRPEMLLLAVATFGVWFLLGTPEFRWKTFLLGLFGGLSMSIHQNAVPMLMGWVGFYVAGDPPGRMVRKIGVAALGFLAGFIFVLTLFDLKKFMLTQQLFYFHFYRPPILDFPPAPWAWLQSTVLPLFRGQTYYFQAEAFFGWRQGLLLAAVLGLLTLAWAAWKIKQGAEPAEHRTLKIKFLTAIGLVLLGFCLFLRRKEVVYYSLFFPFLIPLAGLWLKSAGRLRSGLWLCAVIPLLLFGWFARSYARAAMPYPAVVAEVQKRIGPEPVKVLGPAVLWFNWPSVEFRDLGALQFSRIFTGKKDLRGWLAPWQPDILISDAPWERVFAGGDQDGMRILPTASVLSQILGIPVDDLGTIDTGLSFGPFTVYRLRWKDAPQS